MNELDYLILVDLIYQDLINRLDEKTKILIVQTIPDHIKYIEKPSKAIQLESVKNHGHLIKFIKNPCEYVQFEAVKKHIHAIVYIKKPSESVQLYVIGNIKDNYLSYIITFSKIINNKKALNALYKVVPEEWKEKIKSDPNYKSDAQLVFESIK